SMIDQAQAPALLKGTGQDNVHMLVVCTAERGLCGAFNSAIVRMAREHILSLMSLGKKVKFLCVGKKGYDKLRRKFEPQIVEMIELRSGKAGKGVGFDTAADIGKKLRHWFDEGKFDICTLFFSRFQSVMSQIPTGQQLIPARFETKETAEMVQPQASAGTYEYEPSLDEILEELLPRNISIQIFKAILENAASEQGARMSAMDSATRNAGEMIKKQTLTYNRSRQAMITKELIEI